MVSYCSRSSEVTIEEKLKKIGYRLGYRSADLFLARERPGRRDNRPLSMLNLIVGPGWNMIFGGAQGQHAVELRRVGDNEYHMIDKDHCFTRYVTPSSDVGEVQVGSYTAGIIEGLLHAVGLPCQVSAYFTEFNEESGAVEDFTATTFVVVFSSESSTRSSSSQVPAGDLLTTWALLCVIGFLVVTRPARAAAVPAAGAEPDLAEDRRQYRNEDIKQVFLDLGMGKGKIAAQCAHATLSAFQKLQRQGSSGLLDSWAREGQKKIALKVADEEELTALARAAKAAGLVVAKIHDAGHTQVDPNTLTVAAVGPAPAEAVNKVTGHLKLL